jgi:hypothetical protein
MGTKKLHLQNTGFERAMELTGNFEKSLDQFFLRYYYLH